MSPLARDVIVILTIKVMALALLWFAFFRAPLAPRMVMDPGRVVDHVLVAAPSVPHADR